MANSKIKSNGCVWYLLFAIGFIIFVNLNTQSEEEKKAMVEEKYSQVKAIPASDFCANRDGYQELIYLESESPSTNYYSEIAQEKYESYSKKYDEQIAERARVAEEKKDCKNKK